MKRKPLTRRQAVEIVLSQEGRCSICRNKLQSGNIHYDHIVALELGGADDPSNIQAICRVPCHHEKTFGRKSTTLGSDIHAIAKTKRIGRGGKKRRGPAIKSAGFSKSLRKRMDGTVERRASKP